MCLTRFQHQITQWYGGSLVEIQLVFLTTVDCNALEAFFTLSIAAHSSNQWERNQFKSEKCLHKYYLPKLISANGSNVYLNSGRFLSSYALSFWLWILLHGSCRFIFHTWCYCREDWLYGTGYLTDNHTCSITISDISVPECSALRPFTFNTPHPHPYLFLPFSYFPWDHCYSPTSLHPKLPHAVPGLADCVAAASAEITTPHPGREQAADGIDYLYCQNN